MLAKASEHTSQLSTNCRAQGALYKLQGTLPNTKGEQESRERSFTVKYCIKPITAWYVTIFPFKNVGMYPKICPSLAGWLALRISSLTVSCCQHRDYNGMASWSSTKHEELNLTHLHQLLQWLKPSLDPAPKGSEANSTQISEQLQCRKPPTLCCRGWRKRTPSLDLGTSKNTRATTHPPLWLFKTLSTWHLEPPGSQA